MRTHRNTSAKTFTRKYFTYAFQIWTFRSFDMKFYVASSCSRRWFYRPAFYITISNHDTFERFIRKIYNSARDIFQGRSIAISRLEFQRTLSIPWDVRLVCSNIVGRSFFWPCNSLRAQSEFAIVSGHLNFSPLSVMVVFWCDYGAAAVGKFWCEFPMRNAVTLRLRN